MQNVIELLKEKKPVTIGFLGDSVTQGCFEVFQKRDGGLETIYRPGEAYHHKLQKIFELFYPDVPVQILNAGVSGDSAEKGSARLDELICHQPNLVVVCFGLNDSGAGLEGIPAYQQSLEMIFKRLLEHNISVIFMTPNRMAEQLSPHLTVPMLEEVADLCSRRQTEGVMDSYMDAAKASCATCDVAVCDCYRMWNRLNDSGVNTTELLANRINHPVAELHWLFAIALFQLIIEMA